jgi:hypothetical protein
MPCKQQSDILTDHGGTCYQNSNLQPASAEEQQSIEAAKSLLINSNGDYVGNNLAIFGYCLIADNDTRAANAFIREQNHIIGAAANGLGDHLPDKGHVMKCSNNALYKLAKDDPSLRGVHALCPKQINMLNADISATLKEYSNMGVGDPVAQQACLDQLEAIVPHHSGQHHLCKDERWYTYKQVKREHQDWDASAMAVAAAQSSYCHLEKLMSLTDDGICTIAGEIKKRFNSKMVDKASRARCSNLAENFWSVITKFSHHKGINQDHSDHYKVSNKAAFIRIGDGNVEKAHDQVSARLSLPISSMARKHHAF